MNDNNLVFNLLDKLIHNNYNNMKISYILIKKELGKLDVIKCMAIDKENPDDALEITMDEDNIDISPLQEWSFSIDDNIFYELENGYEIKYIPLETHYGIWTILDDLRDEIVYKEGMQKYLSHCFKNSINSKIISQIGNTHLDVMDLYIESNQGYRIISDLSIGDNTIVLGYKENAPSPFVTWSTTKDRKYGYEIGHYFKTEKDAFKDFESRANALYKTSLERKRNLISKKDRYQYER